LGLDPRALTTFDGFTSNAIESQAIELQAQRAEIAELHARTAVAADSPMESRRSSQLAAVKAFACQALPATHRMFNIG
jgi:hypothetical protein